MTRPELAEALIALVESVVAPERSGLIVTEAEMDVPLEVSGAVVNGDLVFYGAPPHTRWTSGVLPPVHLGHLAIVLVDPNAAEPPRREDVRAG